MYKNKKAFTLVELIITIIILAILGTIAVISLQGYSSSARDSTRISDLSVIKTSLELFHLNAGKYPETTDGIIITYSGTEVWTQGIFGETTKNNVEKLDKVPKDPISGKEYTYSLTKTKQEYQLAGLIEGEEIVFNDNILLNGTNAAEIVATAIVTGNYNGQTLKSETGVICDILSIPSIVSSETSTTDLKIILDNKDLVYSGFNNLPSNYKGSKYKIDEGFEFTSAKLIVYSDNQECKPLYDAENSTARINLVKNLQTAYSGTLIEKSANIKGLVNLNLSDSEAVNIFSSTIINNNLGGSIIVKKSNTLICETGEHTEDGVNCIADISTCSIGNGTGTNTWDGTSWNCTLNTCDTDYYNNGNGACSPVGIGYYSNATDTTRTACTNKSLNSAYTSDGNGTNNCTYSCDSGYTLNGGICQLVISMLYGNSHSEAQCTSNGGSVILSGGVNICRFTVSIGYNVTGPVVACPIVGWNMYSNRTTTQLAHCGGANTCNTGYHSWGNVTREQCTFAGSLICKATIIQIGCY